MSMDVRYFCCGGKKLNFWTFNEMNSYFIDRYTAVILKLCVAVHSLNMRASKFLQDMTKFELSLKMIFWILSWSVVLKRKNDQAAEYEFDVKDTSFYKKFT